MPVTWVQGQLFSQWLSPAQDFINQMAILPGGGVLQTNKELVLILTDMQQAQRIDWPGLVEGAHSVAATSSRIFSFFGYFQISVHVMDFQGKRCGQWVPRDQNGYNVPLSSRSGLGSWMAATEEAVYLLPGGRASRRLVFQYSHEGELMRRHSFKDQVDAIKSMEDSVIVITSEENGTCKLFLLDACTEEPFPCCSLDQKPLGSVWAFSDGVGYVATSSEIQVFDVFTGALLTTVPLKGVKALAARDDKLVAMARDDMDRARTYVFV
jgi:hypothetical protein